MSAAQYRNQIIQPVLDAQPMDDDTFKRNVLASRGIKVIDKKVKQAQVIATEHQIQSAILDRLGLLKNGFFWRENSGLMKLGSPGKERYFRAGINGIADIMGVFNGFSIAIEVKRPGKKQSADQIAFQRRFEECGGVYVLCVDSTRVVDQINEALSARKG